MIDKKAFSKAVKEVVERHEILRTGFLMVEGALVQKIFGVDEIDFTIPESRTTTFPDSNEAMANLIEENSKPFDLKRPPLFRFKWHEIKPHHHLLLFTIHHIVSDVWSLGIFIRELKGIYEEVATGSTHERKKLPIQFKDYVHWFNDRMHTGDFETDCNYWKKKLNDAAPHFDFPTDLPRVSRSFEGTKLYLNFGKGVQSDLNELSRESNATLFMTLIASASVLIHKRTGTEDIIIGTPVAGRTHIDLENQLGCFVNTLPLRITCAPSDTFSMLLETTKATTLQAYEHQDYPFDEMIEQLGKEFDPQRNPLFDIAVVLQNINGIPENLEFGSTSIKPVPFRYPTSKLDLILTFSESADGLLASIEYRSDLFTATTIDDLFRELSVIFDQATRRSKMQIMHFEVGAYKMKVGKTDLEFDFE
jgi:hypothetical protein